jgi:hypothetical protein
MVFAELARRAFSFSALSARKKTSSGESSLGAREPEARVIGVGASESVAGGEGSSLSTRARGRRAGDSATARAKKLGIGSEEGAGEAWNVAPANAEDASDLIAATGSGGVFLPNLAGPGEVDDCFRLALLFCLEPRLACA